MPVRAQESGQIPEAQEGMYTLRFYSGRQGTFNGSDIMTSSGGGQSAVYRDEGMIIYQVPYGTQITVEPYAAQISQPGKYYIRGIRESGKDNQETRASFTVTEDRDYVVAYGVLSDSVAYTIRYLDQNGNELAGEQTYYGNVGDKLIIGFRYFDGYQPQAYNLAKTLTGNAADNIFPFVYTPVRTAGGETPTPGTTPEEEPNVQQPEGGTAGPGTIPEAPGGAAGGGAVPVVPGGAAGPGTVPVVPGGDAAGAGTTPEVPGGGAEVPVEPGGEEEPAEILDLDDQEVPLAEGAENPQGNKDAAAGETDTGVNWLIVAAGIILAAVGGFVALWYVRRRRRQEDKEEENE